MPTAADDVQTSDLVPPARPVPESQDARFAGIAPSAPSPKGFALAALFVGIAAFLAGWVPLLGIALGVTAVVLGIVALGRRQSKSLSIPGIVLGAVGLLVSIAMTLVALTVATNFDTFSESFQQAMAEGAPVSQPVDEAATETPSETDAEDEGPVVEVADIGAFTALDDAGFAAVLAGPDAAVGAAHIVYGEIQQLDGGTGSCSALVSVDDAQQTSWEGYAAVAWIVAESSETECPEFAGLAQYSHVKAWVTVVGVTPTEFEDGTTQDVLTLALRQAELLPALP